MSLLSLSLGKRWRKPTVRESAVGRRFGGEDAEEGDSGERSPPKWRREGSEWLGKGKRGDGEERRAAGAPVRHRTKCVRKSAHAAPVPTSP